MHLQDRHTPILGDDTYGNGDWNKRYRRTHQVKRPLLHAYETQFVHPFTHQKLTLRAPVPPDMLDIVRKIASHSGAGGDLIHTESGLLQCTTEVHGRGRDRGVEDANTAREPFAEQDVQDVDESGISLGYQPGTFVPMDRLVLEEDPYGWQSEADPADLGWDVYD